MKNILLVFLFVILLFPRPLYSQTVRSTTFDNREVCEKDKGVWREFGNGCVGSCVAQLDKYIVCTMALTYGCDCGAGRCWEDGRCVTLEDYKITFDEKQAKKKEDLDRKREARKDDYENNRQIILRKLLAKKKGGSAKDNTFEVQEKPDDGLKEYNKGRNPIDVFVDRNQDILQNKKNQAVSTGNNIRTQEVAPAKNKFEVPAFFLKMQEKEKELEELSKTEDEKNSDNTNSLPVKEELEGLPQIPLPN
jgi:hypothetical protein